MLVFFFFSSRRRHTRFDCDWSSDVCSSDLLKIIYSLRKIIHSYIFSPKIIYLFGQNFISLVKIIYLLVKLYISSPKLDRKSTRLNSSHSQISYAVFCLKKKKNSQKDR